MILQLTNYAVGVLGTNPTPTLDVFKIGSAVNYVPLPTDTDIHGTLKFSGVIAPPVVINANVVKYTISMDTSVGDFDWGEVGLFYQGQLFALAVSNSLQTKKKIGIDQGNMVRLDAFLTVVGTNYNMIMDQADSSNLFQTASLSTIDQLPPSNQTTPNTYIISAAESNQSSFLAYTDRTGLWNFDAYQFSTGMPASVVHADNQSVTIALSDYSTNMNPTYFGQVALEFTTGQLYSICRYVQSAIQSGSTVTLGFQTPMAVVPAVGDKVLVFTRVALSAELVIPIATASVLGAIKIGSGLKVTLDGVCSVDTTTLNAVTSVNGKTGAGTGGAVTLVASDFPWLATVATTGDYNDLINKPTPYVLPTASLSTLGGVKAPTSGNLTISGSGVIDLGFSPVKTVNNVGPDVNGNITVVTTDIGLINPVAVANGTDLNGMQTTGLFTVSAAVTPSLSNAPVATGAATLEVVPLTVLGTGDSIQRWTNATQIWWRMSTTGVWSSWIEVSSPAIATTSSLGVVKVGSGLSVAGDGTLSWNGTALPIASATVLGGIKVGSGLAIAGDGTLSATATPYVLPTASAGTLGGVRIGAGLTIDGSGILKTQLLTVNGQSPDLSGNIAVASDSTKLDKVNGVATGMSWTLLNLGTKASGSIVGVGAASANVQIATFTGGTVTWTFTWPGAGYSEVQFKLVNGGLATHTFPPAVKFINPDGSLTTSLATVLSNQRGTTNFQTSGPDFVVFFTDDNGTTVYCKVM